MPLLDGPRSAIGPPSPRSSAGTVLTSSATPRPCWTVTSTNAEDAVQSAFTQAWQHLPTFRGDASLKTWLYRITANEVLASRRRRRPIPVDDHLLTPIPAPAGEGPVSRLDGEELRRDLSAALAELPWRQRASWVLAEMEGMTYAQIAATLGTNETVVRGQLHRARRTLAVRMAQWR